jgi:hypothetical protein
MPVGRLVDVADDHVLDTSTDGAALKRGWIRDRFMFRDFTDDQPALALAVRTGRFEAFNARQSGCQCVHLGFRGLPLDPLDPHLPNDDVTDFTAMRTAFGLWFWVMFFHRADDELAVAHADRTPPGAGSVEAFE